MRISSVRAIRTVRLLVIFTVLGSVASPAAWAGDKVTDARTAGHSPEQAALQDTPSEDDPPDATPAPDETEDPGDGEDEEEVGEEDDDEAEVGDETEDGEKTEVVSPGNDPLDPVSVAIAIVGFSILLGLAIWWMVGRPSPDSQDYPRPDQSDWPNSTTL